MRCNTAPVAESMHESFVLSWQLMPESDDASHAQDEDGDEPGTPPRNQVSNTKCSPPGNLLGNADLKSRLTDRWLYGLLIPRFGNAV